MNDMTLQGNLQHAVSKVSRIQQIAGAVRLAAGGQYLRCSELILKPQVYTLVKDANALSGILSEAYSRKLVGRVHAPLGKERFAYGAGGDIAVAPATRHTRRGVIHPSEPPAPSYEVRICCTDARQVLELLGAHPGARHEVDTSTAIEAWCVFIPAGHKAAALDLLLAGGFLAAGVSVDTVRQA